MPNASSPRPARARAPGTWSSSQASLVAEKYGSSRRPVRACTSGSAPSARSRSQAAAVRRSCQTMARWTGAPVARSHTTTVSRWLAMPMAATGTPAAAIASRAVPSASRQISSGSCSTQPGAG